MPPGLHGSSGQPVGGGGEIPRDAEVAGLGNLLAEDSDGAVFAPGRANKEITQHELGMIPGGRDLGDGGFALGKQPGEKNRAFYLGTRHRNLILDSSERTAMNAEGRSLFGTFSNAGRTHLPQRRDHSVHPPTGEG